MQELKEKIQKVKPIIRARKAQLDQQSLVLSQIRHAKAELLDNLETAQKAYIEGVDELNRQRQSNNMNMMDVYERGLDYVKDKWYRAMSDVREKEREEQMQLSLVIEAQKNLKAIENLEEKYQGEMHEWRNKSEQKQLDEISSRRSRNKS